MIAGTYTPFTLVNLRGGRGWTLFGLVWSIAIAGIVMELLVNSDTIVFPSDFIWALAGW